MAADSLEARLQELQRIVNAERGRIVQLERDTNDGVSSLDYARRDKQQERTGTSEIVRATPVRRLRVLFTLQR